MVPNGGDTPDGKLASAISSAFGSFDDFKVKFPAAAAGRFGSGWAWLCVGEPAKPVVPDCRNQDSPVTNGFHPILGLAVSTVLLASGNTPDTLNYDNAVPTTSQPGGTS